MICLVDHVPLTKGWFGMRSSYDYYFHFRKNFINRHQLEDSFDYYKVVKKLYQRMFSQIVQMDWKMWIIVILYFILDLLQGTLTADSQRVDLLAWALFILTILISLKTLLATVSLVKTFTCYLFYFVPL